jgi:glyoxylase-like metal-dependent hydrolase (beta-lactamase superfamily II)
LFLSSRDNVYNDAYLADAKMNLEATLAQFQETVEDGQYCQLVLWIDYYQSIVEAWPILEVRAPNFTFFERLVFHGTDRSAELIAFHRGHSESDAVLYLPQEGIVFMGDLLCIDYHPWLVGGDPERFCHALEVVSELSPKLLLPGHGSVGTADSLTTVRQYILTLDGIAQKIVEEGKGGDKIDNFDISEAYKGWLFASFFSENLRYLYQHQLGKHGMLLLE